MIARLVRFEGINEAEWGIGSGWFEEDYLPVAEQTDGFEGAYLFADRERGRVVSVTLWRDSETAAASEAVVRGHLEHYEQIMGRGWTMETFDVALARPPSV